MHKAIKELRQGGGSTKKLRTADFTTTNASGDDTDEVIAEFNPPAPIALRPGARHRMVLATVEEFQTNGTAGDQETFNLSHDIVDSENASPVLYESGNRVQPDSIDYANNTVTYTDDGTGNYLHFFYVPRGDNRVTIRKVGPNGNVSEPMVEDTSISLAERNQNKEPVTYDAEGPIHPIVPQNWSLQVVQNGSVAYEWDDSSETNDQGTDAPMAVLSMPYVQFNKSPQGLARAVKAELIERR